MSCQCSTSASPSCRLLLLFACDGNSKLSVFRRCCPRRIRNPGNNVPTCPLFSLFRSSLSVRLLLTVNSLPPSPTPPNPFRPHASTPPVPSDMPYRYVRPSGSRTLRIS